MRGDSIYNANSLLPPNVIRRIKGQYLTFKDLGGAVVIGLDYCAGDPGSIAA